jgi:glucosyl-dolichyl phosphate glucuronosyltransferase
MSRLKITVIVCTYNRCGVLAKALASVAGSRLRDVAEWEVLVVDNNSTDQTREVVEEFSRQNPARFRYLFEANPGKSYALNAGVRAARGEILAFMDDDVTVEPLWLQNLTENLHDGQWAGVGGRTLPASKVPAPRWLAIDGPYSMVGILAAFFDLGDQPQSLGIAPYGANMAFCKKMFEKYGGFRLDLGPSPNSDIPRPNEDTEFGRRLMAAGERLRYEPSAVAYHPVQTERIRKEYFLKWWFDFGRAVIREKGIGSDWHGIPRQYLRIPNNLFVILPARTLRWWLSFNPKHRFARRCLARVTAGEIVEMWRQSRVLNAKNSAYKLRRAPEVQR